MGSLDEMLKKQQNEVTPSDMSWLKKLSKIYIWIGCFALAFGIFIFLNGVTDIEDKAEAVGGGLGVFFGGLFTLFAGYIGEAIDDIRNNTKK